MMVLVGDPLYNPFKNNPLLTKERLPDVLDPEKRRQAAQAAAAAAQGGQASGGGSDDLPAIEGAETKEGAPERKGRRL